MRTHPDFSDRFTLCLAFFLGVYSLTIILTENLRRAYQTTTGIIRREKKEIIALDGVNLYLASSHANDEQNHSLDKRIASHPRHYRRGILFKCPAHGWQGIAHRACFRDGSLADLWVLLTCIKARWKFRFDVNWNTALDYQDKELSIGAVFLGKR